MLNVPFSSKDEFIEQNLPLVHFVAKQFLKRAHASRVDYEDVFGAGCVGLVKAYNNFDPDQGFQFSTYAVHAISGEIKNYFQNNHLLKIPRPTNEMAKKIMWCQLESKPVDEIADRFGCSFNLVERALKVIELKVLSMEFPISFRVGSEENFRLKDTIPQHEDFTNSYLNDFLLSLTDQEQIVVLGRMEGLIQKEIGQRLGVSQVQVSRLLRSIAEKLSLYFVAA